MENIETTSKTEVKSQSINNPKFIQKFKEREANLFEQELNELRESKSFHGSRSEIYTLISAMTTGANKSIFMSHEN